MKPLAVHGEAAAIVFWACLASWVAFELALVVRDRGRRDAGVVALSLSLGGGVALADLVASNLDELALPGSGAWPLVLGAAVFVAGLTLRARSVHELGRFFTLTVTVDPDHQVVDTGPYRRIRHPSYTGLLVIQLGMGIMLGTWLSIPVAILPAMIAITARIVHEEHVLGRELGDPYRTYMRRTKRLVPGIW